MASSKYSAQFSDHVLPISDIVTAGVRTSFARRSTSKWPQIPASLEIHVAFVWV